MYKSNYTTKGCIDTINQMDFDLKLKENNSTFFFICFNWASYHDQLEFMFIVSASNEQLKIKYMNNEELLIVSTCIYKYISFVNEKKACY